MNLFNDPSVRNIFHLGKKLSNFNIIVVERRPKKLDFYIFQKIWDFKGYGTCTVLLSFLCAIRRQLNKKIEAIFEKRLKMFLRLHVTFTQKSKYSFESTK